jgi:3-hydroxyacyl-[acyl-carrier-protein] dehydratase
MRWFWIDRFDEFVRGKHATAVKNVSLAEEHMHDHFPGAALMPNSLIVEGMAQTAGLLVAEAIDYNRRVVLAKVAGAEFHFDAVPGDSIRFQATILDLKPTGSLTKVTSMVESKRAGRGRALLRPSRAGRGRAEALRAARAAPVARSDAYLRRRPRRARQAAGAARLVIQEP